MTSRQPLRSSASQRLAVPPVRLTTVIKRTFSVSGTIVWNSLPPHVTSAPSLSIFTLRLKTFLFTKSYPHSSFIHKNHSYLTYNSTDSYLTLPPVDLAIINIIWATLTISMMMMMMMMNCTRITNTVIGVCTNKGNCLHVCCLETRHRYTRSKIAHSECAAFMASFTF